MATETEGILQSHLELKKSDSIAIKAPENNRGSMQDLHLKSCISKIKTILSCTHTVSKASSKTDLATPLNNKVSSSKLYFI